MGRDVERADDRWERPATALAPSPRTSLLATLISKTRHSVTATPQTRWASLDGGRGRLRRAAATRARSAGHAKGASPGNKNQPD